MKLMKLKATKLIETFLFIIGFIIGMLINYNLKFKSTNLVKNKIYFTEETTTFEALISATENSLKYDTKQADNLFEEIKIVCLILTQPKDHQTKAQYVKKTWGSKCNKLIFLSTIRDDDLGSIALPFNESREILWGKVRAGFAYAYEHHFNDADWFLKADDDSYFIMENLRYILHQYRPQTAIYIGHRYAVKGVIDGYMAGGGYILSKKALEKFATKLMNSSECRSDPGGAEDLEMGYCLTSHAIPLDGHDLLHQKQFFPVGTVQHLQEPEPPNWWYPVNQWSNYAQGSMNCCADTIACLHYIPPPEMFLYNYLIYHVHPFGFVKAVNNELPRKLSLQEIINASDEKSESPNYLKHPIIHHLDENEKY